MNLTNVIVAINRMEADGVIVRYAIGGAVGATFYVEPISTFDLDVFVDFPIQPDSAIITLKPIFDYLKARGGVVEGEHIVVAGWPVQFLPPSGPLIEEAITEAIEADIGGVSARVFKVEHLAAIALQTGRAKDKARLLQFVEAGTLDVHGFHAILGRHGLTGTWQRFEGQYLGDKT